MLWWIWDWAKYHNSHSSKSIRVTKLFFGQNGVLLGKSFRPNDSLVTLILFELWLLWYLAQSQIHRITLYLVLLNNKSCIDNINKFIKSKNYRYISIFSVRNELNEKFDIIVWWKYICFKKQNVQGGFKYCCQWQQHHHSHHMHSHLHHFHGLDLHLWAI